MQDWRRIVDCTYWQQTPKGDRIEDRKGLLTVKQLADKLAVSDKTIYAWVAGGQIPYVKMGSAVRFRPAAVREWLREKEFAPAG